MSKNKLYAIKLHLKNKKALLKFGILVVKNYAWPLQCNQPKENFITLYYFVDDINYSTFKFIFIFCNN